MVPPGRVQRGASQPKGRVARRDCRGYALHGPQRSDSGRVAQLPSKAAGDQCCRCRSCCDFLVARGASRQARGKPQPDPAQARPYRAQPISHNVSYVKIPGVEAAPRHHHTHQPHRTVTNPCAPAHCWMSSRRIAAAIKPGNASGVQANDGTPSAASLAARARS